MAVGDLVIELELDDKQFTVRMKNAGRIVNQFKDQLNQGTRSVRGMEKALGGLLPSFTRLVTIAGLARHAVYNLHMVTSGWINGIIQANAHLERMETLLRGMSKAQTQDGMIAEAAKDMEHLVEMAKTAPFSLNEMANTMVKFKSVGLDPTNGSMRALVDAVANFGGTDQILHRATVAIQQMAGKGVISMEELRQQLGEAVPNAMVLMARSMGMSVGQLVDEISKGRVKAKPALERLFAEFQLTMAGSSQRMMQTWTGMTQRLMVSWQLFLKGIGDTGMFDAWKEVLQELITTMDSSQAKTFAQSLGESLKWLANQVRDLVIAFRENYGAIREWMTVAVNVAKMLGGFLIASAAAKAIGMLTGVVVGLTAGLLKFLSVGKNVALWFVGFKTVSLAAVATGAGFRTVLLGIGRGFLAMLGPVGAVITALSLFGDKIPYVGKALDWLVGKLKDGANWFLNLFNSAENASDRIIASMGEAASKNDIDVLEKKVKTLKDRLKELDDEAANVDLDFAGQLARLDGNIANPTNIYDKDGQVASLKKKREALLREQRETNEELKAERERLHADLERMEEAHGLAVSKDKEDAMQQDLAAQARGLQEMNEQTFQAMRNELTGIEANREAKIISDEEYWQKRGEAIEKGYAPAIENMANQLRELQRDMEIEDDPAALLVMTEAAIELENRIQSLREEMKKTLELQKKPGEESFMSPKGSGASKQNDFQKWFENMKGRAEDQRAELAGLNGEIAKFRYMVEEGKFKGLVSPEQRAEVERLLTSMEEVNTALKEQKKWKQEVEQTSDSLAKREETLEEQMADLRAQMDLGFNPNSNAIRGLEAMRNYFLGLNVTLPETKQKIAELTEALGRMIEKQRQVDSLKEAIKMDDETRQIRTSMLSSRDQIRANFDYEMSLLQRKIDAWRQMYGEQSEIVQSALEKQKATTEKFIHDMRSPLEKWAEDAGRSFEKLEEKVADWADSAADALADFVTTGKLDFKSLANSIVSDITRIIIKEQMSKILIGGGISGGGSDQFFNKMFSSILGGFGFAKGGVMTGGGALPLRKYAMGGIANMPQMALFGEGNTPEAYVPLPDGRAIPVKQSGGQVQRVEMHIHGVTDARSFRESESQIITSVRRRIARSSAVDQI